MEDNTSIPLQEKSHEQTSPISTSFNRRLYTAACIVDLIAFAGGISFAWTSPMIFKLNGIVDPLENPLASPATDTEASWIAALLCLGAVFGPIIAGQLTDRIGRKKTLLVIAVPMMLAFTMMAFAHTVVEFYAARFINGISVGSTFAVLPMYLAEIAQDHNRGTLGCLMAVFVTLGLLFAYCIGPILSVRDFSLVCLVPLVLCVPLLVISVPESPYFLVKLDNNKKLIKTSLKRLRCNSFNVDEELGNIRKNYVPEVGGLKELLMKCRRALIVCLSLAVLQQFSGINAVLSYLQSIFAATGSSLSAEVSTVIIGAIQVLAVIATAFLVDRLGRRLLFLISSISCGLALVALGVYFHLQTLQINVNAVFWLPVLSLVVYIVGFNLGIGPLLWTVLAELFPASVKSTASTVVSAVCFMAAFFITLFFPSVVAYLGMAKSFWVFAGVCLSGSWFIYWMVPETKGKTLQEIQQMLDDGRKV